MTKFPINLFSKRCYAVVVKSLRMQAKMAGGSVVEGEGKVSGSKSDINNGSACNKEGIFWMRDPKTGNWIPENHFGTEVDAAELRDKFLPKR